MSELSIGIHEVGLRCPDCKREFPVEAEMIAVRTTRSDGTGTLKLAVKSKGLDHHCGEPTLFDDE